MIDGLQRSLDATETKENAMLAKNGLRLFLILGVLGFAGDALGQDRVHDYFNDTALQVKAAENPIQKREILGRNLDVMTKALGMAQRAPLTSDRDDAGLERIKTTLQERRDELAGVNGFDRVPDEQLNAFSTYIVQDMEQADEKITISVVTLLLVLIVILLIA